MNLPFGLQIVPQTAPEDPQILAFFSARHQILAFFSARHQILPFFSARHQISLCFLRMSSDSPPRLGVAFGLLGAI